MTNGCIRRRVDSCNFKDLVFEFTFLKTLVFHGILADFLYLLSMLFFFFPVEQLFTLMRSSAQFSTLLASSISYYIRASVCSVECV